MTESARRERMILGAAAAFVVVNHAVLTITVPRVAFWPVLVWLSVAAGAHVALNHHLPERDALILPVVLALSGWGLSLVARLAPAFAMRQVLWFTLSVPVCLVITLLPADLRILRRFKYTWLTVGLALLFTTILFGVNPSGLSFAPQLWLGFGSVFFQPSELLKLLLIIFLASYLSEKQHMLQDSDVQIGPLRLPALRFLAPLLIMWSFCIILLVWQRDLGTASLFFLVFLSMLYIATDRLIYPLLGFALLLLAAFAGYQIFDVVRLRVDAWFSPWADADGTAYQIVQSLLAIAAGGVFGTGIGLGSPSVIPVVHSDFIFAAIAEEYGLLGTIALMACMAVLVLRALRCGSLNVEQPFHALVAVGIAVVFGVQTLLIVGGVIKLIPLTGVTLPFMSYGGSSLLVSFMMCGLLLRISDQTRPA